MDNSTLVKHIFQSVLDVAGTTESFKYDSSCILEKAKEMRHLDISMNEATVSDENHEIE